MDNSESKKDFNNLKSFDSYRYGSILLGIISFIVSIILILFIYIYLHEGVFTDKNLYTKNTQSGFIFMIVVASILISISITLNITNTFLIKDISDTNNIYYKLTLAFAIISGLIYIGHMVFLNTIPINDTRVEGLFKLGSAQELSKALNDAYPLGSRA